jgi:hypothetical protein
MTHRSVHVPSDRRRRLRASWNIFIAMALAAPSRAPVREIPHPILRSQRASAHQNLLIGDGGMPLATLLSRCSKMWTIFRSDFVRSSVRPIAAPHDQTIRTLPGGVSK